MSNFDNNDFDFEDDDDLFGDFDDEDFDSTLAEDDSGAGFGQGDFFDNDGDTFDEGDFNDFGDDPVDPGSFGDDPGFFDDGSDNPNFETEESGGGGTTPGFIRWIGILGGLLLVQIVVIVVLLLTRGPDPQQVAFEETRAAILQTNEFVETEQANLATEGAIQATTETFRLSITPTFTPTATNTRPPTNTPMPTVDETSVAATDFFLNQTATVVEETNVAATLTAQPTETPPGLSADQIQETGTALANVFQSVTQTAVARLETTPITLEPGSDVATPTVDSGAATGGETTGGTTGGQGLINQDELPDAGLFDDFSAGGSLGIVILTAFGLLGVIAFSRRMRSQLLDNDQ